MELESLRCNHCGAPLEVPRTANYVKCSHCDSSLTVRRLASATFTEKVEQLAETTEQLTEQVSELTRQAELTALDRQWERERESLMITDKNGGRHLPNEGMAVLSGVMIAVFGCIWTVMAIAITSSGPGIGPFQVARFAFPAFGVAFVIFGVVASLHNYQKAKDYRIALRRYQRESKKLQKKLARGTARQRVN